MTPDYDAIVVGGGHNGLTAAGYLARAGFRDAEQMPAFEAMMERVADVLRPMMLRPPPALGSKHPGNVLELLHEAGRAAGLSRRGLQELYRVMTMSVGDLLDDWFEDDALKGAYASTGVVGVWAGAPPARPTTCSTTSSASSTASAARGAT